MTCALYRHSIHLNGLPTTLMCSGVVRAVNAYWVSVYSTKTIETRSCFRAHTNNAQKMSTIIDAETTVTPDIINMPALIDADNEIVWFPYFMIRIPNQNLALHMVDVD